MATIKNGVITTAIGYFDDFANAVITQPDGKILVAGYSNNGSNDDFALMRYNSNGSLDASFDSDGIVTTAFNFSKDWGRSVVRIEDKILVAGSSNDDFALVRYNSDGSLDTSFDSDGKVTTDLMSSSYDWSNSIAIQNDGKILVAGTASSSSANFALVRYNTDGSLDTSFDSDGIVTTLIESGNWGYSVILQPDNKILVVGNYSGVNNGLALARYNSDGSLDTSFDNDGIVTTALSSYGIYSATLQADGKILAAGYGYNNNEDFALVRYNSNGSLDTSFDGDGIVTTDFSSFTDEARSVTVQADGKILVAGHSGSYPNYDFALARYNSDGSLDTSFDGDGKVITTIGSSGDYGWSVAVQTDSKILVTGFSNNGSNYDFALVRYNSDGSLDETFGAPEIPPTLSITATDADKNESGGAFTFTVNRLGNTAGITTVDYSVSGSFVSGDDFTNGVLPHDTIKFDANEKSKVITIDVANDSVHESDKSFNVVLSNPSGATLDTAMASGTIRDDDVDTNIPTIGNDTLLGTVGNDTISGLAGDDNISGLEGDDIISGDSGTDTLIGGTGNDTVDGGADWDIAVFAETLANASITYSSNSNTFTITTASGGVDTVSNVETFTLDDQSVSAYSIVPTSSLDAEFYLAKYADLRNAFGTDKIAAVTHFIQLGYAEGRTVSNIGNDTLNGSVLADSLNAGAGNDTILGLAGNDTLTGGLDKDNLNGGAGADKLLGDSGNDTLIGGLGKDNLTGGAGADKFKFNSVAETDIKATGRDTISDFKHSQGDKIDLSAIDANTVMAGNNAFKSPTVGGAFSGSFANRGDLYFDKVNHILYGNNDADTAADFSILLLGVTTLNATDFVL